MHKSRLFAAGLLIVTGSLVAVTRADAAPVMMQTFPESRDDMTRVRSVNAICSETEARAGLRPSPSAATPPPPTRSRATSRS